MGIAVLDAGADAVFAGLKGFSRRGFDYELTVGEVEELCGQAGRRGKAVRLAVNSYPDDAIHDRLVEDIALCVKAGVDSVILNDPGLCRALRSAHPSLGLHASVGASVFNVYDATFWQDCGATGLVLLCNLPPKDVIPIHDNTGLELEVLVHANRDFTYLGKCWISGYASTQELKAEGLSKVGGSPNRGGVCYRVCRSEWSFINEHSSGRRTDLPNECQMLTGELMEYAKAGVTCFKIQGREYSTALVVEMVRCYRALVDAMDLSSAADLKIVLSQLDCLSQQRDCERGLRTKALVETATGTEKERPQ